MSIRVSAEFVQIQLRKGTSDATFEGTIQQPKLKGWSLTARDVIIFVIIISAVMFHAEPAGSPSSIIRHRRDGVFLPAQK